MRQEQVIIALRILDFRQAVGVEQIRCGVRAGDFVNGLNRAARRLSPEAGGVEVVSVKVLQIELRRINALCRPA